MSERQDHNGKSSLKRKQYEKELRRLQAELCRLQDWVKYKGLRVIVVFEGRDGAGKGGTIRAIRERVSPRVFQLVALPPAPSDREKSQMIFSAIFRTSPQPARWSSLTAVGTTAPGLICHGFLYQGTARPVSRTLPGDRKVHR